jgi:DNA repair protein RecO (recombination protein O)
MPPPDRVYRTEAVILHRHDLGEADRILTLYTPHYGKIRVVAKGVRKPSSRKAGHVELFMRTEMMVARSHSALDIVTQVEMRDAFLPLREDLVRATYASHFVELLDAFTEEADENQALYHLLVNGLGWLCQTNDLQRAARYYELHLLELVGYRPQLFECVICGETIRPRPQFYSIVDGGVLCPSCGQQSPRARPVSLNALKLLRYMQTRPFEAVERIRLTPALRVETENLLHATLVYHLERQLKSVAFLQRLRRENQSGQAG